MSTAITTSMVVTSRATFAGAPRFTSAGLLAVTLLSACATSDGIAAPSGPGAPATLELSTNAVALNGIGLADSIRATVRDAAGQPTNASVTWSSDDRTVAVVVGHGSGSAIVARRAGTTRIRANSGSLSRDVEVRVLGVRSVALAQSVLELRAGDARPVAVIIDADANAPRDLRFTVSNPAVATVTAEGLISGVSAGVATVTVTSVADPRLTANAIVTVSPARAVSFAPGSSALTLKVGESRALEAAADVDAAESKDILWSSENPSVAVVDGNGLLVAVAEGTAIIRASAAADPRASAVMVLTVLADTGSGAGSGEGSGAGSASGSTATRGISSRSSRGRTGR